MLTVTLLSCCPEEDVLATLNDFDKEFAFHSSADNAGMITLSSLAITKSNSPAVTSLSNDMRSGQESASEMLRVIAMDLALSLDNSMNPACASLYTQLETLSGSAFDSMYVHGLQKLKQDRSLLFTNQLNKGLNQRLKNYAQLQSSQLDAYSLRADSIVATFH
jgi:predicted outer membrane protein